MTYLKKPVSEMAREAGIEFTCDPTETPVRAFVECWEDELKNFAELARADEREQAEERVVTLYETCKTPYLLDITKAIRKQGVKDE